MLQRWCPAARRTAARGGAAGAARQRRWGLSIAELSRQLALLEPRDGKTPSEGVRQLRAAFATLQEEAKAKRAQRDQERSEWQYLVVHATGPDKIGMSAEVAAAVSSYAADIEASRSTILAGDFSMMLHVKVRKDKVDDLRNALESLDRVDVWLQPCEGEAGTGHGRHAGPGRRIVALTVQGVNCPGIVTGTSRFLSSRNCNIVNFASEKVPNSPSPLYKMRIVCDAPDTFTQNDVESGIQAVGQVLGTDLKVESFQIPYEI
eukprot:TRINITY_DN50741_c0_g1_i1.p1 TRINITY_DN50741_c0_g1~~TRINITY_DN50741_c0_g1_i1.p1  ORF type:complete len:288 (+),score=82.88 TRINITY_DN50741_c0_g1_i1:81-866(+)